jgi:hypothetical protein
MLSLVSLLNLGVITPPHISGSHALSRIRCAFIIDSIPLPFFIDRLSPFSATSLTQTRICAALGPTSSFEPSPLPPKAYSPPSKPTPPINAHQILRLDLNGRCFQCDLRHDPESSLEHLPQHTEEEPSNCLDKAPGFILLEAHLCPVTQVQDDSHGDWAAESSKRIELPGENEVTLCGSRVVLMTVDGKDVDKHLTYVLSRIELQAPDLHLKLFLHVAPTTSSRPPRPRIVYAQLSE